VVGALLAGITADLFALAPAVWLIAALHCCPAWSQLGA
jgi:hypothetical protein